MAQFLAPEQLENSSGVPLNGGKKHVYQVATTTPLSLFSDEGMTTPAANPIVADESGAFAGVFLAETKCKQIITTSADVTVFTRAVEYTIGVTNTIAADDVSYDNATSGLAAETLQEAVDEVVDLQGIAQNWTSSADGPIATGTSTNTGAAAGPLVEMYRDSASPAASDVIGGMRLTGKNASGVKTTFAEIHAVITDATNGSEDGEFRVITKTNGSDSTATKFAGGTVDAANGFFSGGVKVDITRATVQATTSGTAFDFGSIPATAKRITVMFSGVSLSGTDSILVQIGDSGGIENTGYVSAGATLSTGSATDTSTAGFIIVPGNAGRASSGTMVLVLMDASTNTWISSHALASSATAGVLTGGGTKALSATLDRVRITRSGTDTFDAGSVNISYECA